ncbi:MAG: GNAT family N-acetyltransferase [Pseudomonadota bacterium]
MSEPQSTPPSGPERPSDASAARRKPVRRRRASVQPTLEITPMHAADCERALHWAEQEGWAPGLEDADILAAASPVGGLIARLDARPAASLSSVRYADRTVRLGLHICRAADRGRGLGARVLDHALRRIEARAVTLDAFPAASAPYRDRGFRTQDRIRRYAGVAPAAARFAGHQDQALRPIGLAALDAVDAFDRAATGAPRRAALSALLAGGATRRVVGLVEDGGLRGWGAVRAARDAYRIAPLQAEDEACADRLLAALLAPIAGAPVLLDAPNRNAAARRLAERWGLTPTFEVERMTRGETADLDETLSFSACALDPF